MTEGCQEQAERLLREANVLRLRKQYAEAETRCREALELVPDDVVGLELLGELLYDKGSLREASDLYQKVLELQPGRASAETRLARVILEQGERDHERLRAQSLLTTGSSLSTRERKNRVLLSTLLSLVFAGAGQLYNGDYVKAGVLAVVYLVGWAVGIPVLIQMGLVFMGAKTPLPPDIGWRAAVGLVAVFAWIYGLLDAPARASRLAEEARSGLV